MINRDELLQWINANAVNEKITSYDGIELNTYRFTAPSSKRAIVMVHGFCEFFGKYHELFYRFAKAGYAVYFVELRGHGHSTNTRSYADHRVTVGSFDEYVEDVHAFMEKVVRRTDYENTYLYCHSMGGATGALYLEKYTDDFTCAVLSSPMMEINFGKVPDGVLDAVMVYSDVAKNDDDFAPGQRAFDGMADFEHSSSTCQERYDYQFALRLKDPSYQTWGSTWAWAKAARAACRKLRKHASEVKAPVLVFQAEQDSLVLPEGQERFVRKAQNAVLVKVDTKHEIYSSPDDVFETYLDNILVFYKAHRG